MRNGRSLKTIIKGFLGLGPDEGAVPNDPAPAEGFAIFSHEADEDDFPIRVSEDELDGEYESGLQSGNADQYFQRLEQVEGAIKAGKFDRAIEAARASAPLLGELVSWARSSSGTGAFDIQTIPAIDRAGKVAVALSDVQTLEILRRETERHEDLKPWRLTLTTMVADIAVVESILSTIRENPGYVQKDLKKVVAAQGARLSDLCYWMDKAGRIRREKSGNSYQLFEN